MEINKQLFEDVLSGKLKGRFVLRNGQKINSNDLRKSDWGKFCYRFTNTRYVFTCNGYTDPGYQYAEDVIDFIPDIDMKENELTIEIPDNKVVDWDDSKKRNKIVLKDKQFTYENICEKLFKNNNIFFIRTDGSIDSGKYSEIKSYIYDENNATTEHQLECILAKNKLANVAKYFNNGWKPTVGDSYTTLEYFYKSNNVLAVPNVWYKETSYEQIIFHNEKDAWKSIEILGEETVKLALEPLGI